MSRKPTEIRSFPIEIREDDGRIGFRGYAAVFDQRSHGEVIERGAFANSLSIRDNVKFLINHDGTPLASTAGQTMRLSEDDHGLLVEVDEFDLSNPRAQELVSALKRGDIDKMSFAFIAEDAPTVSGVRHVRQAKLFDVSVVNEPWYPGTNAELNSADLVLALRSLSVEQRAELLAELVEPAEVEEPRHGYTVAEARARLSHAA